MNLVFRVFFANLLFAKQFFVKLNDVTSENGILFLGVLQGSVLSPLLFNWYSQEIENIALGHNIGVHVLGLC